MLQTMEKDAKIYIAGHRGMVGSAIMRALKSTGYTHLVCRTHQELDLMDQKAVQSFFDQERPRYVFLAAARVGGIYANDVYPAEFIYQNLQIQCNVIHYASVYEVAKLLFLGSACIYPKFAPQPIQEKDLMTGLLELTNEAYAVAKISGIKMCQMYRKQYGNDFISVMPNNLYGPQDNYHPENSHVVPALIRRFYEAKMDSCPQVVCWGSGAPRREFLYVDDLADACLFLMRNYSGHEHVNVGTGSDISIKELAAMIARVVGYTGAIIWDISKPDGTPRKLLDVSVLDRMGWHYKTELEEGLHNAYRDFVTRFGRDGGS